MYRIQSMVDTVAKLLDPSMRDEAGVIVIDWLLNQLGLRWYESTSDNELYHDSVFPVAPNEIDSTIISLELDHGLARHLHDLLKNTSHRNIRTIYLLEDYIPDDEYTVTKTQSDLCITLTLTSDHDTITVNTPIETYNYLVKRGYDDDLIFALILRHENLYNRYSSIPITSSIESLQDIIWHHERSVN